MQHSGTSYHGRTQTKMPLGNLKSPSRYARSSGYTPRGSITLKDFELLKNTILWTEDDEKYIRMSKKALDGLTDDILDVWYSFIKIEPHLAVYFNHKSDHYLSRENIDSFRLQFRSWMMTTADAHYDRNWLQEQHEFAEAIKDINFRYILALVYPLTATLKPFLAKKHLFDAEDIECMHQAWIKAVHLQVCLWSQVYVKEGDY